MTVPADINPRIVESLYCDALVLADELRARFGGHFAAQGGAEAHIALTCEGLRATTRTMHCLAWLLNHRAYFAGQISEFQLRRHGRLPPATPSEHLDRLPLDAVRLVRASERLFTRVERLERAWRAESPPGEPSALERLKLRLAG